MVRFWGQNMKKTAFKIGVPLQSGTYYYGTEREYDIYLKDTVNTGGYG